MATPLMDLFRELQGDRTQNEFARLLGVDKSFLSRVMTGDRSPDSIVVTLLGLFPERAGEIAAAVAASRTVANPTGRREAVAV